MLVTLAVLTKDNYSELEATLRSINSQVLDPSGTRVCDLQILIVDSSQDSGMSEDLASSLRLSFDPQVFRDFPPRGVYPAMNLAVESSHGDWILFLNSGDTFFDATSLVRLVGCSFSFSHCFGVSPVTVFGQALICPLLRSSVRPWLVPDPAVCSIHRWLKYYYPNHQSLLVDGSWARAHPFQTDAPQSADRAWMRAALSDPERVAYLPEPVVRFSLGGVSSGLPNWNTLMVRLHEPTRSPMEKAFEMIKFLLGPVGRYYPRLMAFRSRLTGLLV